MTYDKSFITMLNETQGIRLRHNVTSALLVLPSRWMLTTAMIMRMDDI